MGSQYLEQLLADIKEAMKARESEKVTALRMLHAQIKDATVNVGKEESDELVASVVAKAIKQRQDAAEQYRQGNRPELADKETREIEWFRKYQPQQMTESQIEELTRTCIAETGATGKPDAGKVMKALMPQVKGRADGKLVKQIVERLLAD